MSVAHKSALRFARPRRLLALVMAGVVLVFALGAPRVALAGSPACSVGNLGTLCVTAYWSGYNAEFANHSGQCFWADFNLTTNGYQGGPYGTYGDDGSFWTCDGQFNTYFFAVGYQGCAALIVYDRSNGQSPQGAGVPNSCATP